MKKIEIDDSILRQLYIKENYTQLQIAEYFSVSVKVVNSRLKEAKITKQQITKQVLEEQWVSGLQTTEQLAKKFNCSRGKIEYHIKKHKLSKPTKIDIHSSEILKLFNAGYSYYKISKDLGCSLSTIYTVLERAGVKETTYSYNDFSKKELESLYIDQDLSLDQIAKQYKSSVTLINRYMLHFNISKKKDYDISLIKKLYLEDKLKQYEIADILQIPVTTLQNLLKKHNITRPHSSVDIDKLQQLAEKNITIQEIADNMGISRTYAGQLLDKLSIQRDYKNKESSIERNIKNILDKYSIKYEQHNRDAIYPKELDFYLYEYDIGIEICGIYWHSTAINKDKYHIYNKYHMCEKQKLRLITIFEDEITNKLEIVEKRLMNILGKSKKICYARQTEVKVISSRQGIDFLNSCHIQGSGTNSIYTGAFYKNTLVAVMTFAKPSIAKGASKVDWELNRFAVTGSIPGIASKLFKFFDRTFKPETVVSYADLRWNTGNLYSQLGFIYSHRSSPNYWYIEKQSRVSRFKYTKSTLVKKFDEDSTLTEQQIAEKHGLYRIYDCGNAVFKWFKTC